MKSFFFCIIMLSYTTAWAQRVPNESENIDYLITYGSQASTSYGDDDHVQILFFTVPEEHKNPLYIRIYDPDTGGTHDELHGPPNTLVRYSVYGGAKAFSHADAQKINPVGQFKSGNILASKTFGLDDKYDATWYSFGPFNPLQGEKTPALKGYVFKLVVEGLKGNDGNQYRCFLSESPLFNRSVNGANAFAYEYTFKLPIVRGVSHIYPFIDSSVISIKQNNFDYEKKGEILIYSVTKNRHQANTSGDNAWARSEHIMEEDEKNTTIDIQIYKTEPGDNVISVYITNQYDEAIPFFAVPIGGPPKYKYNLKMLLKSTIDK